MTTSVDREALICSLEQVRPGLSQKGIIDQSDCAVFQGGRLFTYNDEVACSVPSLLGGIEGAVPLQPLVDQLGKWSERDVQVSNGGGELLLTGKRRKAGILMEAEVRLPVVEERPKGWQPLHESFCDAAKIVALSASQEVNSIANFVHLHPKFVEAFDNVQVCRWRMRTGFPEPLLVRCDSIKAAAALGVSEWCCTKSWLHLRSGSSDLVFSCRRYVEEFPDLTPHFRFEGEKVVLPKTLKEAAERAMVFTDEAGGGDDRVTIRLSPGKLRVQGRGARGWYSETKKVAWKGAAISFLVSPRILIDLVERHSEAQVTPERIKVDGGRYVWFACLSAPEKEAEDA